VEARRPSISCSIATLRRERAEAKAALVPSFWRDPVRSVRLELPATCGREKYHRSPTCGLSKSCRRLSQSIDLPRSLGCWRGEDMAVHKKSSCGIGSGEFWTLRRSFRGRAMVTESSRMMSSVDARTRTGKLACSNSRTITIGFGPQVSAMRSVRVHAGNLASLVQSRRCAGLCVVKSAWGHSSYR
jgi:hypothetical protein